MKKIKIISVAILTTIMMIHAPDSYAEKRVRSFNRIVIMLDASSSFKNRRMEAVQKVNELLDKISHTKSKRYEGKDEVIIISLDSIPEVIWSGTKEALMNVSTQQWQQRFEARKDYQSCTDIENGFILAARELHKEPRASNLYVFAFTDLVNEPPTKSATKCQAAKLPSLPSADFPWDAFADVETHVLWVPINQKQAWFEVVNSVGLGDIFHIHSPSESTSIELNAPSKARHIMTKEERDIEKEKIRGFVRGIGNFLLYVTGSVVVIFLVGTVITLLARTKNKKRN